MSSNLRNQKKIGALRQTKLWHRVSRSKKETQKIARLFAKETQKLSGPIVIGLKGNLGAGKTTFTQGFARELGIKENILSPTFVLMKVYKIPSLYSSSLSRRYHKEGSRPGSNNKIFKFKHLIHIDCYRMESPKDARHLDLKNFFKDKDAIVLIEWAERIKKILPENTIWVEFKYGVKKTHRVIQLKTKSAKFKTIAQNLK